MQKHSFFSANSGGASLIARALATALIAFSFSLNLPVLSDTQTYPLKGKVFDASYATNSSSTGKGTVRFASDGKGHLYVENSLMGSGIFAVVDLEKESMVTVDSLKKSCSEGPYDIANLMDEDTIKASSTLVGQEEKDGHKCNKYNRTSGLAGTFWVGTDTHFLVHCNTTGLTESEYALHSWSADQPSSELFQVPQDYTTRK